MIDVSIIIVSYNTKDILVECLTSLSENISEKLSYEVIVVDNNSSDGTGERINLACRQAGKQEFRMKNITLIENKENLGFSKANNIAIKEAKGKYILFLNSDTVMYKGTVETMARFMNEHKDAGAATCRVDMPDGKLDDASHRGFPTPWNAFCHFSGLSKVFPKTQLFGGYNLTWMDMGKTHEIDACAGAFMIIRRVAGEQIGWWDEDYFFYGEDLDFCYMLKQHGWKVYFVPEVSILHYKGVSGGIKKISAEKTKANRETKLRVTKARFEAMRIFYRKHYEKKYPTFITWLVMQGINIKEKSIEKTI